MAAIDYAVSVVGFEGVARDYWPHVQAEARRIWARDESCWLSRQTGKPQPVTGWGLRTINFIALP